MRCTESPVCSEIKQIAFIVAESRVEMQIVKWAVDGMVKSEAESIRR